MKNKWEYFEGDFIADQYNDTLLKYSPWSGHRRFAYDLISYYEPENLVELGSHYGGSAFAFAQAIKDYRLKTKYYAIDLWEAVDIYTEHDYERDVYSFFKKIKETEFADVEIEMMRMLFDQAVQKFEDRYVEILHIDGSHEYKDVKHDFVNWLPKMKEDGIVLFHDISEQKVFKQTMGSCIFWKELKEKYPYTAEMQHSWGLGILFLSEKRYRDFLQKVDLNHYLDMCIYEETLAKDRIRTDYFRILDANKWIASLKKDKEAADRDNARLLADIDRMRMDYQRTDDEKDAYIEELKDTVKKYEQAAGEKEDYVEELKGTIEKYVKTVEEKDLYTEELKKTIEKYAKAADEKDTYANELEETIHKYEDSFVGKDQYIDELSETIHIYEKENQKIKSAYEQTIEAKEIYIGELKETIQKYDKTFAKKDQYISELQETVEAYKKENQNIKQAYEQTIQGKDAYIQELEAMKKIGR